MDLSSLLVREELPEDTDQIRQINLSAFSQPQEADLVDRLRTTCEEYLSFVAVLDGALVGQILFTPSVVVDGEWEVARGMGLAPMAVLPEFQNKKIGSALVTHGLGILRNAGCPFVIVLGHSEYYPRFGFSPASKYGLRSQYEGVPDEAFMALVLRESALEGVNGVAHYRAEFDEAM